MMVLRFSYMRASFIVGLLLAMGILAYHMPLFAAAIADSQLSQRGPQSDDFNSCALNNERWTFFDPKGDSTLEMRGTQAVIALPAGSDHDLWEAKNFAPRLMQQVSNEDFEIEVKFESLVTERYQTQGVIIEQDADNFIRLDFYHDGTAVHIFAVSFVGGIPAAPHIDAPLVVPTGTADLYMRVQRTADAWKQSYAVDGAATWIDGADFTYPSLIVSRVGVFAGNVAPNANEAPPAHTAVIDYFFNTAARIAPEDSKEKFCRILLPLLLKGS